MTASQGLPLDWPERLLLVKAMAHRQVPGEEVPTG
jgi:hypothetical protein